MVKTIFGAIIAFLCILIFFIIVSCLIISDDGEDIGDSEEYFDEKE